MDPVNIQLAIQRGILDAPDLAGNPDASGAVVTEIRSGKCVAVDSRTGKALNEKQRLMLLSCKRRKDSFL